MLITRQLAGLSALETYYADLKRWRQMRADSARMLAL